MHRLIQGISSRWRNFYYRLIGVKLNGYVWMQQIDIPQNFKNVEIEGACALDRGVVLLCSGEATSTPKIHIGAHTYINRNTFIDASFSITIGQHCGIGPGCYITDHDHGYVELLPPLSQPLISQPTHIGNQVWIGANVTILKGVTIGNDAVIGAGSVVTKDIPERAIAVGVPAKVIRYKHQSTEAISAELIASAHEQP
ncbi:acyltransferase [Oculatella sp. LEGE 06141]|uniref:acyltransferase n=1 Tax=Oculatella sp. LEGE 06141 TaxID=1828648 RepID=UPI00187E5DDC|nr:acyltransferase [Oculatella sp. LEGE 06141]MBE9179522.1 acyltransferase [Oculatella sp. LEGE 06141]